MQTAQQQVTVPFQGQFLYVVERDGQPYTPMKPIVEGMGLSWQGQHEKLNGNKKRWGIKEILIPSQGGDQDAICLPLRKLPGWLMTIHPNKVRPEIREKVITYQNECDDVLWDYWMKRAVPPAPTYMVSERRAEASRENGKKGGRPRKDELPALPAPAGHRPMKPPVVTKTSGSHTGAVRNLNTVKQLINELQMWGYDELPRDVANAFHECLYELNALLVTGWTEVDEALQCLHRAQRYLSRWQGSPL